MLILMFLICPLTAEEKLLASLVLTAHERDIGETPLSVSCDGLITHENDERLLLYEMNAQERRLIPSQVENGIYKRVWWMLDGGLSAGSQRSFQLVLSDSVTPTITPMNFSLLRDDLVLMENRQNRLNYHFGVVEPPDGASPLFRRSGFIHPLWSPRGQVLTRIQPPDHLHHFGIWNPWTKTRFQGREIDFWNLGQGQGTVRFAGFTAFIRGPLFCGFKARQEHIDLTQQPEVVALNEVWDVRAWKAGEASSWWCDFNTFLSCATDSAIVLEAYRYGGGLGFRAMESWTRETCRVLTSEGRTRIDADGSRARWCLVSGENELNEEAGILFLSHPENRDFPEPMRVWPLDANDGRGDLFFEFCPIRLTEWSLRPGREYRLKYRMVVFDGELTAEQAEQMWQDFAHPPFVQVIPATR